MKAILKFIATLGAGLLAVIMYALNVKPKKVSDKNIEKASNSFSSLNANDKVRILRNIIRNR